jgi:secreted trypsin-like serine protease
MMRRVFAAALFVTVPACLVGDDVGGNDEDIIGGATDPGDPSVVAIFAHQPGATSGSLCTGSVISSTAVLTAAHCVDPTVVGAGNVFEVYTGTVFGQSAPLAVASTTFDPAFDVNNLQNGHDIGMVRLAAPTTLAPLAVGSPSVGQVRLVGFGMNTHFNFDGVPNGAGTKRQAKTQLTDAGPALLQIGDTFHQTCHGDSGGPAFQTVNGAEVIVGVTSFGTDLSANAVCFFGGSDTRVDAYLSFVNANK